MLSPTSSIVGGFLDLSSSRITTDSPSTVGSVATRTSSIRPAAEAESEIRPSCGFRRSAMSSFASTLRRVVTPIALRLGIRWVSCSTPSIRKRTTRESLWGSKWTSLAPSSAASKMIELTRRTSGASEIPSSTSRSSGSSPSLTTSSSTTSLLKVEREPPNASAVRASRPSSVVISSLAATRSEIGWRLASRSESMPWMFCGSEIATHSEPSSKAYGRAVTCSRTCSGKDSAASGSMPMLPSSTTGSPYWAATMRAIASLEASPSSISTCTTGACFDLLAQNLELGLGNQARRLEQVEDQLAHQLRDRRGSDRALGRRASVTRYGLSGHRSRLTGGGGGRRGGSPRRQRG